MINTEGGCRMNKYGLKIRKLRENNNDTLEDLAKKLNMTFSSLGKYERGERKITPELLETISDIYDVKISYFFEDEYVFTEPPTELKEIGAEWVTFAKDMKEKKLNT
jgi:transcriptional regulator with XRE-family HTH domain